MTPQRQEWKVRRREIAGIAAALLLGLGPALAQTTERVVVDRFTGLAIGGVDPVAYFTDGAMQMGSAEFELVSAGAVWRFRNADNRTFFQKAPQIYAPQFGGYDPLDVARGVAVPGTPRLWLIHADRLYLFAREDSRDAFAASPEPLAKRAATAWPALRETLSR
jgi:hypothetical protein